jgi:hypothetical protein
MVFFSTLLSQSLLNSHYSESLYRVMYSTRLSSRQDSESEVEDRSGVLAAMRYTIRKKPPRQLDVQLTKLIDYEWLFFMCHVIAFLNFTSLVVSSLINDKHAFICYDIATKCSSDSVPNIFKDQRYGTTFLLF